MSENMMNPRFIYDKNKDETYDTSNAKSAIYLINNLAEENWKLRGECTKLKLVMNQIIEDLEKTNQHEYARWIKSNCNVELLCKRKL